MAFGDLALDREVIEVQHGAVSLDRRSHHHILDQDNHCPDQPDHSKVMNRYACRSVRTFVEFVRQANRCCFVRPRVWEDEGNDDDALVLVVHKQRSADGSPLVLYIPWPYR
jgi:hypothetical protein